MRGALPGTLPGTSHLAVCSIGLLESGLAGWQASAALVFGAAS